MFFAAAGAHLPDFEFFMTPFDSTIALFMRRNGAADDMWAGVSLRSTCGPMLCRPHCLQFGKTRVVFPHGEPLAFVFLDCHEDADPQIAWFLRQPSDLELDGLGRDRLLRCQERASASVKKAFKSSITVQQKTGTGAREIFADLRRTYEAAEIAVARGDRVVHRPLRSKAEWLLDTRTTELRRRGRALLGQLIQLSGFDNMSFPGVIMGRRQTRYNCLLWGKRIVLRVMPHTKARQRYLSGTVSLSVFHFPEQMIQGEYQKSRPFHINDEFDHLLILFGGGEGAEKLEKVGVFSKEVLFETGFLTGDGHEGCTSIYLKWNGDVSGTKLAGLQDHILDLDGTSDDEIDMFLKRTLS